MNSKIKVYFIYEESNKQYTASNNRFWGLHKMVSLNFECEIIYIKIPGKNLYKYKALKALILRAHIIKATIRLLKLRNLCDINVLYLLRIDPLLSLWFWFFSQISKYILMSERNELPQCVSNENIFQKTLNQWLIFPWYFKIFHGYTFMTHEIQKYYNPFLSKNQISTILPMTVDFKRFDKVYDKPSFNKYIFYAGSLNNKKDGINYLINIFFKIKEKFPEIKLVIATNSSAQELNRLKNQIGHNDSDNINFLHQVPRDVIPGYMKSALICVLPRPLSKQAQGGFPTKLGEYLAASRPVVLTKIGEIPNYLTEEDVFFISTDNIQEELTERIIEIIENYPKAIEKGLQGYNKAKKHFSIENNASSLDLFIKELVTTKNN